MTLSMGFIACAWSKIIKAGACRHFITVTKDGCVDDMEGVRIDRNGLVTKKNSRRH